jgi:uncharacterized protein YlxW (UPF0749 family)
VTGYHSSWRDAFRRAASALLRPGRAVRRPGWSLGVPVIALVAGLLFTTSATTAAGTPLREDRRVELTELIEEQQERVDVAEAAAERLRGDVEALTDDMAGSDTSVVAERDRAAGYQRAAGLTALHGPGLTVTLDDALRPDGIYPPGAQENDLLVHQQDLQAVVNALWAGGAEAMTIMGVRVITTSAVICVGPVLLLHGRPYSPPYEVSAIGDPERMRASLAASAEVRLFREAADAYGLGYQEVVEGDIIVPAFDGTSTLRSGQVSR